MKKAKKVIALTLCAVMLVVGSVAGTMAYLTSSTGDVVNTFTVGNVTITLDEANVDLYGDVTTGRTTEGNQYKLIPGHEYTKDPVVHVENGSENSWVFVKVENNLGTLEATTDATYKDANGADVNYATIQEQILANGWVALDGVANVYYKYYDDASTETNKGEFAVFENFVIAGNANADTSKWNNEALAAMPVTIDAYAVQADGFVTAKLAWDAATPTWEAQTTAE